MNIQAMMKQAQKIQKDMMEEKEKIDQMVFEETNSFVTIKAKGNKEIIEVIINEEKLDKEDIEMVQDLILVTTNAVMKKIDKEVETKMGKYTQGMPGLF